MQNKIVKRGKRNIKVNNRLMDLFICALKKKGFKVTFQYKGKETVCILMKDNISYLGSTLKHPRDNNNLKLARNVSFFRAYQKLIDVHEILDNINNRDKKEGGMNNE